MAASHTTTDNKSQPAKQPSMKRKALFALSLYRRSMTDSPWTHISDGLFLSRLPFAGEHIAIADFVNKHDPNPLGAVISIVEPWELKGAGYFNMATKDDWQKMGVEQHVFPMRDGSADLSVESIADIVRLVNDLRQRNISVLVHCKAGMARSASIVLLHLLLFKNDAQLNEELQQLQKQTDYKKLTQKEQIQLHIKKTEAYLVSKRPQVKIETVQKEMISQVIQHFEKKPSEPTKQLQKQHILSPDAISKQQVSQKTLEYKPQELKQQLDTYLASSEAKQIIARMPEYKSLQDSPVPEASGLLSAIQHAIDSRWFANLLLNEKGAHQSRHRFLTDIPLEYIGSKKQEMKEYDEYKTLTNHFKKNLSLWLSRVFWCKEETIKSSYTANEMHFNISWQIQPHK